MSLVSVTTEAFPVLTKYAEDTVHVSLIDDDIIAAPTTAAHEEKKGRVRELLEGENTTATGVFRAAQVLLGPSFISWEPESIWLELGDQGVVLPGINRDKLLALSTLVQVPAFYWDANVFENTALACASEPVLPDLLQEASPAQLTWAVYECEVTTQSTGTEPDFDYEPAKYAAVSMFREGMVLAPELLEFAQEELDRLNRKHTRDLRDSVRDAWNKLYDKDKGQLNTAGLKETPLDIQLARLAAIQMYFDEMLKKYQDDIRVLGSLLNSSV